MLRVVGSFPEVKAEFLAEKASSTIARVIRGAILDGSFEPGRPLREEELAGWLGISRTPIREALLILENEGLVESVRNRSTYVARFDPSGLEEVYSIRAVLEGYAARQAAELITPDELDRLSESCERFKEVATTSDDLQELAEENFTFHETIQTAARSARLQRMIAMVTALPLIYRSYMTYSSRNRRKAIEDHVAILGALSRHDGDAAGSLMEEHVEWARDVAVAHLIESTKSADEAEESLAATRDSR
jgi:DNA-binding GntR family transcriptional regulator